jgi:hypothetical protein
VAGNEAVRVPKSSYGLQIRSSHAITAAFTRAYTGTARCSADSYTRNVCAKARDRGYSQAVW